MSMNDINSLSHTKWICKYHIVFAMVFSITHRCVNLIRAISISDGQPKAMPDYTGELANNDMKQVIQEYGRKGVLFLAAAIGQDKETICDIYGPERFLDITDLRQLPVRLVQIIARYL